MQDERKVAVHGYVGERLRDLVVAEADREGIPVSEVIARLLAKAVNRPDLGEVPRRRMGRPRKTPPHGIVAKKGTPNGK
jgi:hypothetical protein